MSDPMISTATGHRTRELLQTLRHKVRQTARRWRSVPPSKASASVSSHVLPGIFLRSDHPPTNTQAATGWVEPPVDEIRCRMEGRTVGLWVRRGTQDAALAKEILSRRTTWRLPTMVQPKVIFDIGAGVGIWALYLSTLYPQADLFCFEPDRAKAAVLRRNASRYSQRVRVIGRGLSDRIGQVVRRPGNTDQAPSAGEPALAVTSVREAMRILGLDQVDLFHLHAPGSEMAILEGMDDHVRRSSMAWMGQLHGIEDWRFCQLLETSHHLAVNKPLNQRSFPFMAVRRDLLTG